MLKSMGENEWTAEIGRLKRKVAGHPKRDGLVVFYGSSSIRLWNNLTRDLSPLNLLNLGFGGSSLYWCNFYFEELFRDLTPFHLVVYAGENDLDEGKGPDVVNSDLKTLIGKARSKNLDIKISVISLKPSPARMHLMDQIRETNQLFEQTVNSISNASMIWIHDQMLDPNGQVYPHFFTDDRLHMNEKGYEIWTDIVRHHFDLS